MKTSELTGAPLDWAVAKADGKRENDFGWWWDNYKPSTDWAQGGPIIEREKIGIQRCVRACEYHGWLALKDEPFHDRSGEDEVWGETPLIAAMRCYVASQMGDEVEIPEELTA